jgi:hypothetical protein
MGLVTVGTAARKRRNILYDEGVLFDGMVIILGSLLMTLNPFINAKEALC